MEALYTIRPNSQWSISGDSYSGLLWLDTKQSKPTQKELEIAIEDCRSREELEKIIRDQAKVDLNNRSKTDAERINAIVTYLGLDK